jgi:predicted O-methyltransferase YrrM
MSAEELSPRLGANRRILAALLDACVAMGLLERRNGGYANSHVADAHLVAGKPLYIGDFIEVQAFELPNCCGLYDVITGDQTDAGSARWNEFSARRFTLAMHNLAMTGEAEALATAVDLSGCETMVDVGCGSGMYTVALCQRNPALRATLLDQPEVLSVAMEVVRYHGITDRITAREADIATDAYGEGLDLVLLSDVLYQDRETVLSILRSAHSALATGGMLVIRGYFSDPGGTESLFGALFVVKLLASDPSREAISLPKLNEWLCEVGFKQISASALTARSTCLSAVR